jgi:hypothetical protein
MGLSFQHIGWTRDGQGLVQPIAAGIPTQQLFSLEAAV